MALPSSGAISLNEIHIEVGGSSGSQVSLNDSDVRDLKELSSGASSSFSNFYGAKAPFTITLTSGGVSLFIDGGQYGTDSRQRYRGFALGQYNSNWPGSSAYGSLSSNTDSDYLNNNQLIAQAARGITTATETNTVNTNATVIVRVRNISGSANNINSNASFKSININGTLLNRSDATYSDGGVDGIPSDWQWTVSNQSIPPNNTAALAMYPASGSTCTVKFRGQ